MKVLIADDETMICEWLQFCIAQNVHAQVAGIAHNGVEALQILQREDIDLVLADIKMPVMDGLELLEKIRGFNDHIKVVMLTAFSDFELVRKALRLGAVEYLLKTEMNNTALQEVLDRVSKEFEKIPDTSENDIANMSQLQSVVRRILRKTGELDDQDIEKLYKCGIRWRNNGLFALAVWKQDILKKTFVFPKEDMNGQVKHIAGFDYTERIYVIVGNLPKSLSSMKKMQRLTEYARQVQATNNCMVGTSTVIDEMHRIPYMVWQAASSLGIGFYEEKKRLYEPQYPLSVLIEKKEHWKEMVGEFRTHMHQVHGREQYELIKKLLSDAKEQRVTEIRALCGACIDAIELLEFETHENGDNLKDADTLKNQLHHCISISEVRQIMDLAISRSCIKEERQVLKSPNVRLAVDYMNEHFGEQISLEQIAERVRLNSDYFSRIFKAETGKTFINYLTDIRMYHSIYLLENTVMQVQNIAQQVGYYNASYFSTIFKKKYGVSPYEYRRNKQV